MRATILLIAMPCLLPAVRGADWPNWQGPDFNGISTEKPATCLTIGVQH